MRQDVNQANGPGRLDATNHQSRCYIRPVMTGTLLTRLGLLAALISPAFAAAGPARLGPGDIPADSISIPLSIPTIDEEAIHAELNRWSRHICRAMRTTRTENCRRVSITSAIIETHVLGSTDRHLIAVHLDEKRLRRLFSLDTFVPVAIFRFRICRNSAVAQAGERVSQSTATVSDTQPCFDPIAYLETVAARLEPQDRPRAVTLAKMELIRRVIQAEAGENDPSLDSEEDRPMPQQEQLPTDDEEEITSPPPTRRDSAPRSNRTPDTFIPRSQLP